MDHDGPRTPGRPRSTTGQPDRIPVDFGGTAVTGMHVTCVWRPAGALRARRSARSRSTSPTRCSAGSTTTSRLPSASTSRASTRPNTMFGFPNDNWKPVAHATGPRCSCPGNSRRRWTRTATCSSIPRATARPRPAAGCRRRLLLRHHHPPGTDRRGQARPRGQPRGVRPDLRRGPGPLHAGERRAAATGRGSHRHLRRDGLRRHRPRARAVPQAPKGIRDVEEWYVSTVTRQDYVHQIFARQCEIALANLARIHARVGDAVDAVFVCGTDFGTQTSTFCSRRGVPASFTSRTTSGSTTGSTPTRTGRPSSTPAARWSTFMPAFIDPASTSSTPCSARPQAWTPSTSRADYGDTLLLGRRGRHAEGPALRHAGGGPGAGTAALRCPRRTAASSSTPSTTSRPRADSEHRRHVRRRARKRTAPWGGRPSA